VEAQNEDLTLALEASLAPHATRTLWFRLPYEFPVFRNAKLSKLSGEALLVKAAAQWEAL
jgi:hypothetical protein